VLDQFMQLVGELKSKGADQILIKSLANNDNSKQQIYLGGNFEVVRAIPSGDVYSDGMSSKGPIFKAPLKMFWIDVNGETAEAPNAQLILYPKYPEVRMSGFLKGCKKDSEIVPRELMQPPTKEQRAERGDRNRFLILGIVPGKEIYVYCSDWQSELSTYLSSELEEGRFESVSSVLYRFDSQTTESSKSKLLKKLYEVYESGEIESCRLDKDGNTIPYKAQNGAGYTLEAQFDITPNGCSDPDFMDWELKVHSKSAVTLMTPEPNIGSYLDSLYDFLKNYGSQRDGERLDFTGKHVVGKLNEKSSLTMRLEGFDPETDDIVDPEGGLFLRDDAGNLAAGWKFDKLITHWKNKHSNTCFVASEKMQSDKIYYKFGPKITLGIGTDLDKFLKALYTSTIYYDPGINMKLVEGKWKPKKRNQFRVSWKNISALYSKLEQYDLSD